MGHLSISQQPDEAKKTDLFALNSIPPDLITLFCKEVKKRQLVKLKVHYLHRAILARLSEKNKNENIILLPVAVMF